MIEQHGIDVTPVADIEPAREVDILEPAAADDRAHWASIWRMAFRGGLDTNSVPLETARSYAFLVAAIVHRWLNAENVEACCHSIARVIREWRPDVVIATPLMLPASLAAEVSGTTMVSCGYPGPMLAVQGCDAVRSIAERIRRTVNLIRRRCGLREQIDGREPSLFFASDRLQLVYFPPGWFGDLAAQASDAVQYVGAHSLETFDPHTRSEVGDVVLAVSSTYVPAQETLCAMFDAVGRVGRRCVIGGAGRIPMPPSSLPPHVRVTDWIDYVSVLPKAAAIIHHGGMGTTQAAARAATPQLVLPALTDQILHAEAVMRHGAGVTVTQRLHADEVANQLDHVLTSREIRAGAERLRDEFARYGGVTRAAALLENVARRGN
jgi:UDP:flavonoid glycosyltransferase YjiC (YdhE family)